jgi:hypothetical protein
VDWLKYKQHYKTTSIRATLGGVSSCASLAGGQFDTANKLIKLQLKGMERTETTKSVGGYITPAQWLLLTDIEFVGTDRSLFASIILASYFGWRIGTILRL